VVKTARRRRWCAGGDGPRRRRRSVLLRRRWPDLGPKGRGRRARPGARPGVPGARLRPGASLRLGWPGFPTAQGSGPCVSRRLGGLTPFEQRPLRAGRFLVSIRSSSPGSVVPEILLRVPRCTCPVLGMTISVISWRVVVLLRRWLTCSSSSTSLLRWFGYCMSPLRRGAVLPG
jgi:hypothetical protein